MNQFKCIRETGKRRTYVVTNPAWNNRLREMDNTEAFGDYIQSTLGETVTAVVPGKTSNRFFYFQTFYIAPTL